MNNTPAMIIDFEATDVSKEAEATQIGYAFVEFVDGKLSEYYPSGPSLVPPRSNSQFCKPDRAIGYGAMAISHIMPKDIEHEPSHRDVAQMVLPKGEAYIVAHNADFDIQVAANAGVDVSQYKRICTQALARRLMPDIDSHSLGALTYAINPELAKKYYRHAHDAGWDVTFTLWLLIELCRLSNVTSMDQLYLASEEARIPTIFTFGKHEGKGIKDVACHDVDRKYLNWVLENIEDKPYLLKACTDALNTIKLLNWMREVPSSNLPIVANIDNGDSYHVYYSTVNPRPYSAIKKVGDQLVDDAYFDTLGEAKAWCVKHFNYRSFL